MGGVGEGGGWIFALDPEMDGLPLNFGQTFKVPKGQILLRNLQPPAGPSLNFSR